MNPSVSTRASSEIEYDPSRCTVNLVSVPPMSIDKEPAARDRLLAIDGLEAGNHKHAREEARGLSEG